MNAKLSRDGGSARVELSPEALEAAGLAEAEQLQTTPGRGLLVLREAEDRRPWLAGSLRSMSVGEVLGFANSTLKTAVAAFRLPSGARKTLWIRDGQVVFGSSTDPDDRLGPTLLRAGLLTLAQLVQAEGAVTPAKKLGKVLVELKLVRPTDVYVGVAGQVRHIILGLFDAQDGQFSLCDGPLDAPSEVKLAQRTRDLLLEGLKRSELEARVSALVPDRDALLQLVDGAPAGPAATPGEAVALGCIDGLRSVAQVVAASRLGAFDGFVAVGGLIEAGRARTAAGTRPVQAGRFARGSTPPGGSRIRTDRQEPQAPVAPAAIPQEPARAAVPAAPATAPVRIPPAPGLEPSGLAAMIAEAILPGDALLPEEVGSDPVTLGAGAGPFEVYRRAIRHIHEVLREETIVGQANLELFLLDPPAPYVSFLDGLGLSQEGELDVEQLQRNARAVLPADQARGKSLEALEQFLSYALFEAKNLLTPDVAARLMREVAKIQFGGL